jgi:DNA adenine methylase
MPRTVTVDASRIQLSEIKDSPHVTRFTGGSASAVTVAKTRRRAPKRDLEVPRPFLKFAGGKSRLLPELCERLPAKFGRYHEPFVGGGALFWHLQREGLLKGGAVLSDANERLVRAYRGVRDDVGGVIEQLYNHALLHKLQGRTFFERIREAEPEDPKLVAAWLIYLNKTCFNGLYRVNRKGEFNVSFGDYKDPKILDEENLRACSRALREVELYDCDFEVPATLGCKAGDFVRGDLVYFDPPYVPLTKTALFTGYTSGGFSKADQERLADLARDLKSRGIYVVLTNSDHPLVRELYPEPFWKVERVEVRGDALNTDGAKRGKVGELIIS